MRKQAIVATILAALCSTAIAAKEESRTVRYSVKVTEGSKLVSNVSLTTRDGVEVPFASTREQAYLGSCTAEGEKTECKPDTVKTGLSMKFLPSVQSDGRIATHFVVAESVLDSMESVSVNGMTIQLPQVSKSDLDQSVMLASGKTIELPFGPMVDRDDVKRPKYTMAITATLAD